MPRNAKYDRYVKPVRAKGKLYLYFDTGRKDERGKPVYARLPDLSDKRAYGSTYAAYLAARTRREAEPDHSELTVPQLWKLYQLSPTWRELKLGTQRVYFIYLERFAKLMPTAPAGEITSSDIVRLMDRMGETPGAANLFAGAIGSLYKWARERGHIPKDCRPTKDIRFFDLGEHDPWPERVLEAALRTDDADVRLAVHLLYYTAQRLGDVLAMRWTDIRGNAIEIKQDKTGIELHIPLHKALKAELDRTPRNGIAILTKPNGKRWKEGWARDKLQAFGRKHNAEIVPHGLRKNAVNTLLEIGCSVAETSAISGQSLQMVEHYAKKRSQPKLGSAAILRWNKA